MDEGHDFAQFSDAEMPGDVAGTQLELAARVGRLGRWELDFGSGRLVCDERWYRMMGRDPDDPISSPTEFRRFIHPDDVDRATEVEATVTSLTALEEDYGMEFRIVRPNGEIRWVRSIASLILGPDGKPSHALGMTMDVTEEIDAKERLRAANLALRRANDELARQKRSLARLALLDGLTGIANRRSFDGELARICKHCALREEPLVIAMLDVDHFKEYNDHYGHLKGDEALRLVAGALNGAAGEPPSLAARYGGEEFVLLLPGCTAPEDALERLRTDIMALGIEHCRSAVSPHLTGSIGAVSITSRSIDPEMLMPLCDEALYQAKRSGRNRLVMRTIA